MRLIGRRKVEGIAAELSRMGLDAALFVSGEALTDSNLQYLTGIGGLSSAALILTESGTKLMTTALDYDRAAEEAEADEVVRIDREKGFSKTVIESCTGFRKIGVVRSSLTVAVAQSLGLSRARTTDIGKLMSAQRAVKEPRELEAARESARIADRGVRLLEDILPHAATEAAVAAELEMELKKMGSEEPAFETIVTSGLRSAFIHPCPGASMGKIGNGLGIVDFGATYKGYRSDVTVPFCRGHLSEKQETMVRRVTGTWEEVSGIIRDGAEVSEMHAAYEKAIKSLDMEIKHSLGHGIGLDIHEHPGLSDTGGIRLATGMVLAVEPGAYDTRHGGTRIENDVIVTKHGCEVLTKSKLIRL